MTGRRSAVFLSVALVLLVALSSYASIRITGLQRVTEEEALDMIHEQVEWLEQGESSRPKADDAAFFLERELRRRGFKEADVGWDFEEATREITLIVEEGTRQEIGDIPISGNVAEVSEEDIRTLVKRATANRNRRTLLQKKESALAFVESDIETGLGDVRQLYRSLGYWEAKVAPLAQSMTDREGTIDIHVQIEAGTLHRFRGFDFEGADESENTDLQTMLAPLIGAPFSTENVNTARSEVAHYFGQRGYYQNQVDASPTDHGDEITLGFTIATGKPFEVASIRVEGNERVKATFLTKRFEPLIGEPYSPEKADKIYRDLLEVGLFTKISLSPEEIADTENDVELVIEVEETKARSVGVYGGYGSYDGAILGFIFRENNVFGTGRQFKATAEYTQRGLRGETEYSDLWFHNTPFYWNAKLFGLSEQHEGYEKFEAGARAEFGREIGEHYSVSVFATMSYTDILDAEIADIDLGAKDYRVGSIGLAHSWDTRNNPALPSKGFVFDNTLEYATGAFGSEIDFLRGSIRFSTYIPITKRTQLSLGARSGFIAPSGDTEEIPIDLRFFSGGSTSVRSFRDRHMGPADIEGYPLGGLFYNTFNAEYTVPIVGGLKAAAFADAGNLLADYEDASLEEMHYAVGGGLRYDLPTGPIRFDYGWNANRSHREPSGTFHLSIGFAF